MLVQYFWFRHSFLMTSAQAELCQTMVTDLIRDRKIEINEIAADTLAGMLKGLSAKSFSDLKASLIKELNEKAALKYKNGPIGNSVHALLAGDQSCSKFLSLTRNCFAWVWHHYLPIQSWRVYLLLVLQCTRLQELEIQDKQHIVSKLAEIWFNAGSEENTKLGSLHAVVLSLKSFVLSTPYDVPSWLPEVLMALVKVSTRPNPVRATVRWEFAIVRVLSALQFCTENPYSSGQSNFNHHSL